MLALRWQMAKSANLDANVITLIWYPDTMQPKQSTLATLWRFIRPESEELVFYLVALLAMLGLAGYRVAVQGQIGQDSQSLIDGLGAAKETLFGFFNMTDSWGRLFLFGFWFLIGTVTYVIAWSLITMLIDISNDIKVSSSFVHPKSFHQSDYWVSILSRVILRVAAGGALLFYGIFWLGVFAPVWVSSFQSTFGHGFTSSHITDFVFGLVGVAFSLHIGAILLRLMLLRAHYSYED